MSRVLTNNLSLAFAVESSLGVLPGSPVWYGVEPNTIGKFGATIATTPRAPITKNRQRRKGTTTDLDSSVEFEADLTLNHFRQFMEGFVFATFSPVPEFVPTAVTSTGYTVASGGAIAAGLLVYARGFTTPANNGLKVVGSSSTGTEVKTSGLTAEASPPTNVRLAVAGVQGSSGDLTVDSSGNINSTLLDFTTLGLSVGQTIWVGGSTSGTQFAVAANTGFARVKVIAATKLTLDKKSTVFATDNGSGKTVQLLFGKFLKNVAVDDALYIAKSYQFEIAYPDLGGIGTPSYEYPQGNYCNEVSLDMPLTNKATMSFAFVGTDTPAPTTTRKTNAASAIAPLETTAFNTSADLARLRITQVDETGITTDFKSLKVTLKNNVSPEKVLNTLGAKYLNTGLFEVDVEAQLIFTDPAVTAAIRANTTVTMDFAFKNDNGGAFFDLPSVTLGGGDKSFPVNQSVLINTTASSFLDPTLGTSIGISAFPYLP